MSADRGAPSIGGCHDSSRFARRGRAVLLLAISLLGVLAWRGAIWSERTLPRRDGVEAHEHPDRWLVDVNLASAAELTLLPGVGPTLARRIIESREREGPLASVEEIERVSGIGPRLRERIRPWLRDLTSGS
ncbi:MAG: helix-hairpin-helix domain-containing protein [Phycisphaeraceae bacterium]|nr:helix-hairpin-helix domain-containing protein [Phycisphaeraceae bacterium]